MSRNARMDRGRLSALVHQKARKVCPCWQCFKGLQEEVAKSLGWMNCRHPVIGWKYVTFAVGSGTAGAIPFRKEKLLRGTSDEKLSNARPSVSWQYHLRREDKPTNMATPSIQGKASTWHTWPPEDEALKPRMSSHYAKHKQHRQHVVQKLMASRPKPVAVQEQGHELQENHGDSNGLWHVCGKCPPKKGQAATNGWMETGMMCYLRVPHSNLLPIHTMVCQGDCWVGRQESSSCASQTHWSLSFDWCGCPCLRKRFSLLKS